MTLGALVGFVLYTSFGFFAIAIIKDLLPLFVLAYLVACRTSRSRVLGSTLRPYEYESRLTTKPKRRASQYGLLRRPRVQLAFLY
jgi:hypothetical protein